MPSPPTTTSASTPSATHWRARSSASSASRPSRLRTTNPASRSRGSAASPGARALALAGRGVGQQRDLARVAGHGPTLAARDRRPSAGRSAPMREPRRRSRRREAPDGLGAAGRARRGRGRRSNRVPGTARVSRPSQLDEQDLAVPPGLVGAGAEVVVGDRRRVGLVDGQQVAGHGRRRRRAGSRRARGARCASPSSGGPGHLAVPSHSGRSNGSTSRQVGSSASRRQRRQPRRRPRLGVSRLARPRGAGRAPGR